MTGLYAVIGNPIRQSKSPSIHSEFARQTGQKVQYGALEAPLGGFVETVRRFRDDGGQGLNVTAPFKLDAVAFATVIHDRARQAGAANCLSFVGDRVEAENFDGIGLLRDITVNLAFSLRDRRVLVLGAGGAARGALVPLLEAGPAALVVANRTGSRAVALADRFHGVEPCDLHDLRQQEAFDLVINATSAGLHDETLDLPATVFDADALAYDMTYGRGLTGFLRAAQQADVARLHDGVGMLVEQAAEAFAWWRGVRPDTAGVIERLTVPLA